MSRNRAEILQDLQLLASIGRHVLLEGPVGVGKTRLAREVISALNRGFQRVDGDNRFTESKLVGSFDPRLVMDKGYVEDAFLAGPLLLAMQAGSVLLLNELNRLPESVQNVLLPVLDEGFLDLPKLGRVEAKTGFWVIATQNPAEFVATQPVSEALLDRLEWMQVDYPTLEEERAWLHAEVPGVEPELAEHTLQLVRASRVAPEFRRGGSVRASVAVARLAQAFVTRGAPQEMALRRALEMGFLHRSQLADEVSAAEALEKLIQTSHEQKKKSLDRVP